MISNHRIIICEKIVINIPTWKKSYLGKTVFCKSDIKLALRMRKSYFCLAVKSLLSRRQ